MKDSLRTKLEELVERHEDLSHSLSDPEIIGDQDTFRRMSQEYAQLETLAADYRAWRALVDEIADLEEMADADEAELREMAEAELDSARGSVAGLEAALRRHLIPKDPNDNANLYLEIRAGTGGDEAALFAGDLLRMYASYAEKQGWQVEILSESHGEHGGYKEVISRLIGTGAFSRLKFESGAHRVQRVPATESQGRIHTSACTVAVMPELDAVESIDISPNDLRIDTFRAAGAGGQHVNKTESAVRITHLPTGIAVQCQTEKSQHQNRAICWDMLRSRLYELELEKKAAEAEARMGEKSDIGWGHQIRSYVLQPYQMVKDLRTGVEIREPDRVLDGDIDPFMAAALAHAIGGGKAALVEDIE